MSKNKKKKSKKDNEEELIVGYSKKRKNDKPPTKKKKSKNKAKKIKKILIAILKIILILCVLVGIGLFLFVSPVFNITSIRVENASKISENTYIALSEIQIGENIFRISKSKIREKIMQESYVEELEIKREFPGTVVLNTTERIPKYMIEKNGGLYLYIDKNGYCLEETTEKLEIPILRGILTDIETLNIGTKLSDEDIDKFNDLIKITDGMKNKNIETKSCIIDITDANDYKIEFASENKKVMLGDISNLSTKMEWIKYFMQEKTNESGTIHLNTENVYFSPEL